LPADPHPRGSPTQHSSPAGNRQGRAPPSLPRPDGPGADCGRSASVPRGGPSYARVMLRNRSSPEPPPTPFLKFPERCAWSYQTPRLNAAVNILGSRLIFPCGPLQRLLVDTTHFIRSTGPVSYTHLRAHETKANLVCRL